jgi:hypothetical protein
VLELSAMELPSRRCFASIEDLLAEIFWNFLKFQIISENFRPSWHPLQLPARLNQGTISVTEEFVEQLAHAHCALPTHAHCASAVLADGRHGQLRQHQSRIVFKELSLWFKHGCVN